MLDETQSVAVIGTGRMGAAMARRLADAGHTLTVWNRSGEKAEQLARTTGAKTAGSAAEAARGSDVVITSLADDSAVIHVYLGDEGVLSGASEGSIVLDTSTIDPETVHRVGAAFDEKGISFLDCPVSGSVASVESGSLLVMAGGVASALDAVRPILESFSKEVLHTGPSGSGAACKLAVNALVHGLNIALAEALVLAERAGVDRAVAYDVFERGAAGAPFVSYKRAAFEDPDTAEVAFTLDLVAKDLELITGLAQRVGAPMKQGEAGLEIVQEAIENNFGARDLSAVAVHLRSQA